MYKFTFYLTSFFLKISAAHIDKMYKVGMLKIQLNPNKPYCKYLMWSIN